MKETRRFMAGGTVGAGAGASGAGVKPLSGSRRRVVVKNNSQAMQETSTIERATDKNTAAMAGRNTNETPQIINIVNTATQPSILQNTVTNSIQPNQQNQQAVFNQDLGIDQVGNMDV